MKAVSREQAKRWKEDHDQYPDPYGEMDAPPIRIQSAVPTTYAVLECFLDVVFNQVVLNGEILLQCMDREPEVAARSFIYDTLTKTALHPSALRNPSILVEERARHEAIGLFALTVGFKWKTYAFAGHDQIVLYNWEGDVLDFWTSSEEKAVQYKKILKTFRLREFRGGKRTNQGRRKCP